MPLITVIATRRVDDPLPTNVQHLMTRLASHFQVIYIEPAVDILYILRNLKFISRFIRKCSAGFVKRITPIILPFENRLSIIRKINQFLFLTQLRFFLVHKKQAHIILWLFSPKDYYLIGKIGEKKLYFHMTDDYSSFPEKKSLEPISQIKIQEDYILKKADRVFVTSRYLAKLNSRWSSKIILVPNVADVKHFEKAQTEKLTIPHEIASINRPIAGFVGAVDHFKIDFDLIRYCAYHNANIAFVLIGPVGHGDSTGEDILPQAENIFYLGIKPYNKLPSYLKAFDICLIPYRITKYTRACFPLKLYEYLSAGKPVVSTNLPAVRDHREFVYVSETNKEFSQLIRTALKEDTISRIKARQEVIRHRSWDQRVEDIKTIILDDVSR